MLPGALKEPPLSLEILKHVKCLEDILLHLTLGSVETLFAVFPDGD